MDINHTLKKAKLGIRDFTNRITGQNKLINEYQKTTLTLCTAANYEKDAAKKKKLYEIIQKIDEKKWKKINNGNGFDDFEFSGFNENKPFQKKKISNKIAQAKKTMDDFGIKR